MKRMREDDQEVQDQKYLLRSWNLPQCVLERYFARGIVSMFDWQLKCLTTEGVLQGKNIVYSAPTSSGKTLVAEILAMQSLVERKKKVLMILPFVSVVREKTEYFKDIFSDTTLRVGGFMGSINPVGGFKNVDLAIATIEKGNNIINKLMEENELQKLGCVIVDELHLIGDHNRGYLIELMLTKLMYMARRNRNIKIQIVGMSATLPNLQSLTDWLDASLYYTNYRPVPLTQYLKIGHKVYNATDMSFHRDIDSSAISTKSADNDVIHMCLETILSSHSVLIFCNTKKGCEEWANTISSVIKDKGAEVNENAMLLREQFEARDIANVLDQLNRCPAGLQFPLRCAISFGAAFHHAGLTMEERDIIENAFRQGIIRVLVATSTLSSGVNLPSQRVIIMSPFFCRRPIDILTYQQMAGRAGRMGIDDKGESYLICSETEGVIGEKIVRGQLPPVKSSLNQESSLENLKRAIIEVIAAGVVINESDLEQYLSCTLLYSFGENDEGNTVSNCISSCIQYLIENGFIKKHDTGVFSAQPLSWACFSSSLSPSYGLKLESELQLARHNFALDSDLHIIYQVTPYTVADQWQYISWEHVMNVWDSLSADAKRIANLVCVEEWFLRRMVKGSVNTNSPFMEKKLALHRRFYTALALQDLVNEMSINEVASKYGCSMGMLQSLQQASSAFAGMVTQFCEKLYWPNVELLVSQFSHRLHFGVQRELIDLLRCDILDSVKARELYKSKITSLADLAVADPTQVYKILCRIDYNNNGKNKSTSNYMRITGRYTVTEREVAKLIIEEARKIILNDLGILNANWRDKDTLKSCAILLKNNSNEDIREISFDGSAVEKLSESMCSLQIPYAHKTMDMELFEKSNSSQLLNSTPSSSNSTRFSASRLYSSTPDTNHLSNHFGRSNISSLSWHIPDTDIVDGNTDSGIRLNTNLSNRSVDIFDESSRNNNDMPSKKRSISDTTDGTRDLLSQDNSIMINAITCEEVGKIERLVHHHNNYSNPNSAEKMMYNRDESYDSADDSWDELFDSNSGGESILNASMKKEQNLSLRENILKRKRSSISRPTGPEIKKTCPSTSDDTSGSTSTNVKNELLLEELINADSGVSVNTPKTKSVNIQMDFNVAEVINEAITDCGSDNDGCEFSPSNAKNLIVRKIHESQSAKDQLLRDASNNQKMALKFEYKRRIINSEDRIGCKIINFPLEMENTEDLIQWKDYLITGYAITFGGPYVYYADFTATGIAGRELLLNILFETRNIVIFVFNGIDVLQIVYNHFRNLPRCTMLDVSTMDWLLCPTNDSVDFLQLVRRYVTNVNEFKEPIADVCLNSHFLWTLGVILMKILKHRDLTSPFLVNEMPIQKVLTKMSIAGMKINVEALEEIQKKLRDSSSSLEERLNRLLGHDFNYGSKLKWHKVKNELAQVNDDDMNAETIYKSLKKLDMAKSQVSSILENIHPDGRIHPHISLRSETGRIYTHTPCTQTILKNFTTYYDHYSLRSLFVAPEGYVLLSADYCHLELRILAHFSKDKELIKCLNNSDPFVDLSAIWNNIGRTQVSTDMRNEAKRICYGVIYGMSTCTLAKEMGISEELAEELHTSFMEKFSSLRNYLSLCAENCSRMGYVKTIVGRLKRFGHINENHLPLKKKAERQAVNMIIQGSAADLAKMAMRRVNEKLEERYESRQKGQPEAFLVNHIHDELMYEVAENKVMEVACLIKTEMESLIKSEVMFPVKLRVGKNWRDLYDFSF